MGETRPRLAHHRLFTGWQYIRSIAGLVKRTAISTLLLPFVINNARHIVVIERGFAANTVAIPSSKKVHLANEGRDHGFFWT